MNSSPPHELQDDRCAVLPPEERFSVTTEECDHLTETEQVTGQHLQGKDELTGCPTGGRRGFFSGAQMVLPGSGTVPHVYSSPPHSQPMGRCIVDIPAPPPQASSSSFSLCVLEKHRKKRNKLHLNSSKQETLGN